MEAWEVGMAVRKIDRDKLKAAIRNLGNEHVFDMLDEALGLLPPDKLFKLAKRYLDPSKIGPDAKAKGSLLADVKAFEQASLAGEHYEAFDVNSKNYTQQSPATRAWVAQCTRLLGRSVARAKKGGLAEAGQAFDIIFGLLDTIDEDPDGVIFFADEAGSWQVGVDWENVLPAWFSCLSETANPDEYARRVREMVGKHCDYRSDRMLAAARKAATPAQRKALRTR